MTYPLDRIVNHSEKDLRFTWPGIIKLAYIWSEVDHGLKTTRFVIQKTKDPEIKPGLDIPHGKEFKGIVTYSVAGTNNAVLFEFGDFHEEDHGFKPDGQGVNYYFWDNNNNAINGVSNSSPLNYNFWNGGPESLWLVFEKDRIPTFQRPSKT
jgi:hypothetical protein